MPQSHHCIDKKNGDHVFSQKCIDAKHMEPCDVHPEKWIGPGRECAACKAMRFSADRQAKDAAKKKRENEENAKAASKANGWDWTGPQGKLKDKRNKVAEPEGKGKGKEKRERS